MLIWGTDISCSGEIRGLISGCSLVTSDDVITDDVIGDDIILVSPDWMTMC